MNFIYADNRNSREKKIIDATIRNDWTISDIFKNDEYFVSCYKSEKERLSFAPALASLAFGEDTAFHGFGQRILEARDISTKSWLCAHLLDEAKHTEAFSRFLDYFYPSYKHKQHVFFNSRDVILFYGYTHRSQSLLEWLLCTQIAEVFGRHCYKGLYAALKDDPIAEKFLKNIITDEARHIGYIGSLIDGKRHEMKEREWSNLKSFIVKMITLGRNMFEARTIGANYRAFLSLDLDVTQFCNEAETALSARYL